MKNIKWLALILVFIFALSACSAAEPAAEPTAPISATPTAEPTPAPTAEPAPAAPSLEDVMPLLRSAAVAATADNVEPFDGQSDPVFTDAFMFLMLRNETYPTDLIGVTDEGGYKTVDPATMDTLYSLYFDSGSFPGLTQDGFGVDDNGAYSYMMSDPGDLSPVCEVLDSKEMGDGLYRYTVSIAQKDASDGSVEPIGELKISIRRNTDSYFGFKLVSLASNDSEDKENEIAAYFGRDANEALTQITPLFEAIALSAYTYKESFDGQPSDNFAWSTVYSLLNHHYKDFTGMYVENDDGTLSVSSSNMRMVFLSCFAYEYEELPAISSDFQNIIAYDAQNDSYIIMHADGEMITSELTDLHVTQDTLTADMVVKIGDGDEVPFETLGTVSILIDHNLDAQYYNNVLSAQYTAAE